MVRSAEKILHLASFDRWTGAAAPAFSEVDALRRAGVAAHYAFVGGYTLERKLADLEFAHPLLVARQDPVSTLRVVKRVRALIVDRAITVVHAHQTHDHWIARLAARGVPGVLLVRTFHSRRTMRRDPVTRWLLRGTSGVCVINASFAPSPALRELPRIYTPPPVDEAVLRPGPDAREIYGIGRDTPLLGFIGKVAEGRGFEEAIRILAIVRRMIPATRLLLIGRGPHRPALEALTRSLGVEESVIWAGYHEDDLAEHFRSANAMLFTAPGSDEGHRAIVEAMSCGTPVVAYPLFGVPELMGPLAARLVAPSATADAAASVCERILSGRDRVTREECERATEASRYPATAERLSGFYSALRAAWKA